MMPAAPIQDLIVAQTNFTLPPLNALFDAMFGGRQRGLISPFVVAMVYTFKCLNIAG